MFDIFLQVLTWVLRSAVVIGVFVGVTLIGMMLWAEWKDHDNGVY